MLPITGYKVVAALSAIAFFLCVALTGLLFETENEVRKPLGGMSGVLRMQLPTLAESSAAKPSALRPTLKYVRCYNMDGSSLENFTVSTESQCPRSRADAGVVLQIRPSRVYTYVGCIKPHNDTPPLGYFRSSSLTISSCLIFCDNAEFNYGSLTMGDTCRCQHSMDYDQGFVSANCSTVCNGTDAEFCGGAQAVSAYHIRSPDGGYEWTQWMRPADTSNTSEYATRFRDCFLDQNSRYCNATVEKTRNSSILPPGAFDHFIGCFAFGFMPAAKYFGINVTFEVDACLTECRRFRFAFALIGATKRCRCINSLGVSRAISSCDGLYGVGVYNVRQVVTNEDRVFLNFDSRLQPKKVLLLAYYRSGSTFVSELFNSHPGALYLFEPDMIYGRKWTGDVSYTHYLHEEYYRGFERFLQCDVYRIPGGWMALNTFWPRTFERTYRFGMFCNCAIYLGFAACLSYFQVQCEAASMLAVKTIRVTATPPTAEFIRRNADVIILHLMRDPRGILSSQKVLGDNVNVERVQALCSSLDDSRRLMDEMSRKGRSAFNIRYEDFASEPITAAQYMYDRIFHFNLTMSMKRRILEITGLLNESSEPPLTAMALHAYSIHRKQPLLSLKKYKTVLSVEELRTIDATCAELVSNHSTIAASTLT